jgi:Glycyl-tRNA synthetase beta subunit/Glycyl-tRNA synthetase alpha subunit
MAFQDVRHFKEISYTDSLSYGELYGQAEYEMSRYYLDEADVAANRQLLTIYVGEARRLIAAGCPSPPIPTSSSALTPSTCSMREGPCRLQSAPPCSRRCASCPVTSRGCGSAPGPGRGTRWASWLRSTRLCLRRFPSSLRPAGPVISPSRSGRRRSVAVASLHSAKNMHWRDPELSFNRPIRWILALWGDQVIPVSAGALTAGRSTRLLRTADKPLVEVRAAETLLGQLSQLSQAGLITDPAQRRELIETSSSRLAALAGGTVDLAAEAPLVDQLTYLIEEPNAILGQFDPGYLELPEGRSLLRPCRPWPDFLDSFAPDHKEGLEDGLRRRMGSDRSGYGPDAIGVLDRRAAVRLQR